MTRSRGELETAVVHCLADSDRPLTAADVQFRLDSDLAYTTVTTTLVRLWRKGATERTRHGRAYAYQLTDRAGAGVTARQLQRLMAASEDRAAVLSRFLAGLEPSDAELLATLLRERNA